MHAPFQAPQHTIKLIAAYAGNTLAKGLFVIYFGLGTALAGVQIQHWTHSSGAKVYLGTSPAIPMVDVLIEWDAGSRRDPALQAGLADATAAMLSRGVAAQAGAPALDENALGEAWADLGASFSVNANNDRFGVGLRSLTYPDLLDKAAALAGRMISSPAWSEAVWARDRARWVASIQEAQNRPATLAGRAFAQAVYGSHPYGFEATEATPQGHQRGRHEGVLHPPHRALRCAGQHRGCAQPRAGRRPGGPHAGRPGRARMQRPA